MIDKIVQFSFNGMVVPLLASYIRGIRPFDEKGTKSVVDLASNVSCIVDQDPLTAAQRWAAGRGETINLDDVKTTVN